MCHTCIFSTTTKLAAHSSLAWSGQGCYSYGLLSHEVFVTTVILSLILHVYIITWKVVLRRLKTKPQSSCIGKTALILPYYWAIPYFTMQIEMLNPHLLQSTPIVGHFLVVFLLLYSDLFSSTALSHDSRVKDHKPFKLKIKVYTTPMYNTHFSSLNMSFYLEFQFEL